MPAVTVPDRPSGEPTARTGSPTRVAPSVGQRQRAQRGGRRHPQHGDVAARVGADHLGGDPAPVAGPTTLTAAATGHHVVVGDDVARGRRTRSPSRSRPAPVRTCTETTPGSARAAAPTRSAAHPAGGRVRERPGRRASGRRSSSAPGPHIPGSAAAGPAATATTGDTGEPRTSRPSPRPPPGSRGRPRIGADAAPRGAVVEVRARRTRGPRVLHPVQSWSLSHSSGQPGEPEHRGRPRPAAPAPGRCR